jgi:hypothetical protein
MDGTTGRAEAFCDHRATLNQDTDCNWNQAHERGGSDAATEVSTLHLSIEMNQPPVKPTAAGPSQTVTDEIASLESLICPNRRALRQVHGASKWLGPRTRPRDSPLHEAVCSSPTKSRAPPRFVARCLKPLPRRLPDGQCSLLSPCSLFPHRRGHRHQMRVFRRGSARMRPHCLLRVRRRPLQLRPGGPTDASRGRAAATARTFVLPLPDLRAVLRHLPHRHHSAHQTIEARLRLRDRPQVHEGWRRDTLPLRRRDLPGRIRVQTVPDGRWDSHMRTLCGKVPLRRSVILLGKVLTHTIVRDGLWPRKDGLLNDLIVITFFDDSFC